MGWGIDKFVVYAILADELALDDQASLLLKRNQGRPRMRKIIAIALIAIATPAFAGKRNPSCDAGFTWNGTDRRCERHVDDDKATPAKCTPGSQRTIQVRRGARTINVVQRCGYM